MYNGSAFLNGRKSKGNIRIKLVTYLKFFIRDIFRFPPENDKISMWKCEIV